MLSRIVPHHWFHDTPLSGSSWGWSSFPLLGGAVGLLVAVFAGILTGPMPAAAFENAIPEAAQYRHSLATPPILVISSYLISEFPPL